MNLWTTFGVIVTFSVVYVCLGKFDSDAPFTDGEVEIIRGYFEANIGYSGAFDGCVVASPSDTNPDYLYHWQRDAAITMNTLQFSAPNSSTFDERFQNYVKWVLHVQALTDPNGIDVRGEPKFNPDGSIYTGGWCRPQNDGPASRSIALTEYAFWLISQNRTDYVTEYLYTPKTTGDHKKTSKHKHWNDMSNNNLGSCSSIGDASRVDCGYSGIDQSGCEDGRSCCWAEIDPNPNNYPWCFFPNETIPTVMPTTPTPTAIGSDAISTDLNYVSGIWSSTDNCDLWEEQTGAHWYTYMVQRHALIYGASLAAYFGDDTVAASWNGSAESMVSSISAFDNGTFINEGTRQLDCSIIVGTLYGGMDGLYPPTDLSVLNTMSAIQDYFSGDFAINSDDTSNGIPGVLVGRYVDDSYDGCLSDGGSQGHAWVLCSNALGDVYYRNAEALMKEENADNILNGKKLGIYGKIIKRSFPKASQLLTEYAKEWDLGLLSMSTKNEIKNNLAMYMTTTGDDQLTRVKYHIQDCNYHMSEQICESNGQEIGAYDLTWSYGTFLSAWYHRGEAIKVGTSPMEHEIDVNWDAIRNLNFDLNVGDNSCAGCTNQCDD